MKQEAMAELPQEDIMALHHKQPYSKETTFDLFLSSSVTPGL